MSLKRSTLYCLWIASLLCACAPVSDPNTPYTPGFFYLTNPNASLVFSDTPNATPRHEIPLPPVADCSLYAVRPAPLGRWIAVEWDCPSGPQVELLDSVSGKMRFAINDQSIDNRLLAWHPDGQSIYLKIGTLSFPQTLRVEVETGRATELPISAFVYDLAVSPDGQKALYSLSNGIGFGSETWLGGENAQNASQILVEPRHIVALAQFSPDGQQLAYIKMPDSQEMYPPGELWVMASDGSQPRFLAPADAGRGFSPVWSPDGSKIAFVGRNDPVDEKSINVSVYDLSLATLLTTPAAPLTTPVWSPDGGLVAFTAVDGDKMNLWSFDVVANRTALWIEGACCAGWIR